MFGQSASTNTFGQPTAFGASTTPFGAMNSQSQPQQTGLFGQTSTPSLFGMNQSNSIFGTPNNTSQTNTFGAQPSTFGATNTSLFGNANQQQSNSLFGNANANRFGMTPTSGFGSTIGSSMNVATGTTIKFVPHAATDTMVKNGHSQGTNINIRLQCITCMREYETKSLEELRLEDYNANRKGPQSQQPQQQGNLFGTSTLNSGSLFGNTNTSNTFGSSATTTNNLFNNQNKLPFGSIAPTTTTTSLFGSNLNANKPNFFSTPATGFAQPQQTSLFNNPQASQPIGGSLFNTNTLNTNTSIDPSKSMFGTGTSQPSTIFGQNTQLTNNKSVFGTPFGTQPQTSTSLFGNNSNTGNLFGSSSQPAIFNSNTATQNTGLGNKSFFNFSSQPLPLNNPPGLGTTTSTSNLFGSTNNAFGTNTTSNLFGSNLNSSSFNFAPSTQQTFPSANTSFQFNQGGFGLNSSSLNQNNLNNAQQALQNASSPVNSDQIIARLQTLPYGNSPQLSVDSSFSMNNIKTKFTTDPKTLNQYKISAKSQSEVKVPRTPLTGKPTTLLFDGLDDESTDNLKCAQDIFQPRPNIKKLILSKNSSLKTTIAKSPISSESQNSFQDKIISNDSLNCSPKQVFENTMDIINKLSNEEKQSNVPAVSPEKTYSLGPINSTVEPESPGHVIPKCGIILTRTDYYTIPTIEECDSFYDSDKDSCVIENFTVGRIDYGSIYWKGPIDVKGLNLDEIVHIRRKEVIVYPDDDAKPPVGDGLNRPAQVTLDQVWPIDKTSREFIKDADRLRAMKYSDKVENATIKLGAVFKEYRPDTGSWVFTVKHFSKYGLDAEDEEFESDVTKPENKNVSVDHKEKLNGENFKYNNNVALNLNGDSNYNQDIYNNEIINDLYPGLTYPKSVNNDYRDNIPVYDKYNVDNDMIDEKSEIKIKDEFMAMRSALFIDDQDDVIENVTKKCKNLSFSKSTASHQVLPSLFPNKFRTIIPKKRKLTFKSEASKQKADIYSFCQSAAPKVNFINGSNKFCFVFGSEVLIFELDLLMLESNNYKEKLEQQLSKHSTIKQVANYPPIFETIKFCLNEMTDSRLNSLIEALYGELREDSNYSRHQERIRRIQTWLFNYNKSLPVPDKPLMRIIHFLTTNELEFAITECINSKQPRLAYLVSCGPYNNKSLIVSQLDSWKRSEGDVYIDKDLLKLYVLLSGQCQWSLSNGETINIFEDLEWTQQLVLILLYKNHHREQDVIGTNLLKSAIQEIISTPNVVEYHLLAQSQPWVAIASCSKLVDSWFLLQALSSYNVIVDDVHINRSDSINLFLSSQAKELQWALYFILHVKNNFVRYHFTKELLFRNATQLSDPSLETFLKEKFLIKQELISEAKLFLSKTCFDNKNTAFNLINCGLLNEAHEILVDKVFPELVINENHAEMIQIIDKLKSNQNNISNWNVYGAGIYETFLKLLRFNASSNLNEFKSLIENFNVHQLRCPTKRHVLCQGQMARVANIIHAEMNNGMFAYNTSVPDDYTLLELRSNVYKILEISASS